ncbi:uncharacterized protein LOC110694514 [Chenopodium quinoa]|uniref:uncharacterized protein LOC110694514 n=1 Tax=Chenopodium quinoa TaxID=63459 RepID=UPI000B77BB3F|nr:uncharacterized protein LOC110694514 [Chenopodium quinoa]XP_021727397.1 uncharacterized protein LOC110694514 [Chenopodium quinoa]
MFAKWSDEYEQGVDEYVKRAFAIKSQGNQICCPCQTCHYQRNIKSIVLEKEKTSRTNNTPQSSRTFKRGASCDCSELIRSVVGPTKEIVQEFKFFLGTVARDSELAPLNYRNFPSLPTLDKILDYVQEKYMVPHAGLNWVMDAVNSWKYYKCQIKKKHFYAYDTDDLKWEHYPDTISDQMFLDLLQYWHTDEAKAISQSNKSNRLMLDDMHTLGRKSYAILRHELQQQDPDKKEPSQAKVYKESRKRSAERTYISSFEKAKENIDKIDALESAQSQEDGNVCNDPYSEVIPPPKRKSRLHLCGSGVKKSDLKNKDTKSNYILPEEFLVGIKTQLVQEIAPTITAAVLDSIREVNPGINLVVPSTLQQLTPHDASSAPNRNTAQSGQSSKSFNQVVDDDELPQDE